MSHFPEQTYTLGFSETVGMRLKLQYNIQVLGLSVLSGGKKGKNKSSSCLSLPSVGVLGAYALA